MIAFSSDASAEQVPALHIYCQAVISELHNGWCQHGLQGPNNARFTRVQIMINDLALPETNQAARSNTKQQENGDTKEKKIEWTTGKLFAAACLTWALQHGSNAS